MNADLMLKNVTPESIVGGSWAALLTPVDDDSWAHYAKYGDTDQRGEGSVWAVLTALLAIRDGGIAAAYAGPDLYSDLNEYIRTGTEKSRMVGEAVYAALGEQNQRHPVLYRGYRFSNASQQDAFVERLKVGRLEGLLSCSEDVNVAIGFAPNAYSLVLTINNPPASVPVETHSCYDAECEQVLLGLSYSVEKLTYHPSGLITATLNCKE